MTLGRRILILAAHPDDEVVACCAAAGRARAQGSQVFVLYMTDGCVARETLWPWQRASYETRVRRRLLESERAAQMLDLTPVDQLPFSARQLWRNLAKALEHVRSALADHAIDQVWVPAYEGGNADHDGLNALGQKLFNQADVLEFAEYNYKDGRAHSQEFPYPNGKEQEILLTAEEQAQKQAALALYASERGNLNYVRLTRETYRPLAVYDYATPPHPGTLWYARFQWVPFPHPRVDFTRPQAVCQAIAAFLGAS